jgi:hypothetical protein
MTPKTAIKEPPTESLEQRLTKINAYSFRNEWIERLRSAMIAHSKRSDSFLLEISMLYEKRHVINNVGELINSLNKEIYANDIRIEEIKSIIRGL